MASSFCDSLGLPPLMPASLRMTTYSLLLQDGLKPEGIDKDVWLHQKMKNTNYLTEYDLSEFENIGAIGLELWQVIGFFIFFSLITPNFSLNSLIHIAVCSLRSCCVPGTHTWTRDIHLQPKQMTFQPSGHSLSASLPPGNWSPWVLGVA